MSTPIPLFSNSSQEFADRIVQGVSPGDALRSASTTFFARNSDSDDTYVRRAFETRSLFEDPDLLAQFQAHAESAYVPWIKGRKAQ